MSSLGTMELELTADISDVETSINEVSSSLEDLQGTSGATQGSLDDLGSGSEATGGSLENMGGSTDSASMSFMDMDKSMMAAVGTIGAVVAGIGATIAVINEMVASSAAVGDQFHKMAIRSGETAESLQGLQHAAGQSGVKFTSVERAMYRSDKAMGAVADSVANATTHQDALNIAVDEYGERLGAELLPLLWEGSEGIKNLSNEAVILGGVMSKEGVQASADYSDAVGRADLAMQGLTNTMSAHFMPAATDAYNMKTDLAIIMQELVKGSDDANSSMEPWYETIARGNPMIMGAVEGLKGFSWWTRELANKIRGTREEEAELNAETVSLAEAFGVAEINGGNLAGTLTNLIDESGELERVVRNLQDGWANFGQDLADDMVLDLRRRAVEAQMEGNEALAANLTLQADLKAAESDRLGIAERNYAIAQAGLKHQQAMSRLADSGSSGPSSGTTEEEDDKGSENREDNSKAAEKLQIEKELTAELARQAEMEALSDEMYAKRMELLYEEDALRKAELELEILLLEIEQQGIEGKQAEFLIAQQLLEVDAARNEMIAEQNKKQEEGVEEAKTLLDLLGEHNAAIKTGVGEFGNMGSAILDAIGASDKLQAGFAAMIPILQSAVALKAAMGDPLAIAGVVAGLAGGIAGFISATSDDDDDKDSKEKEKEDRLAKKIAKEIGDDQDQRFGRPLYVNVDARGSLLGEEIEVGRKMADLIESEMSNRS